MFWGTSRAQTIWHWRPCTVSYRPLKKGEPVNRCHSAQGPWLKGCGGGGGGGAAGGWARTGAYTIVIYLDLTCSAWHNLAERGMRPRYAPHSRLPGGVLCIDSVSFMTLGYTCNTLTGNLVQILPGSSNRCESNTLKVSGDLSTIEMSKLTWMWTTGACKLYGMRKDVAINVIGLLRVTGVI